MIHYSVGWCDGCCAVWCCHWVANTRCSGVDKGIFSPLHSLFSWTIITFRWTISCYRTCAMRRLWLPWRTHLTWFIWRWQSQGRYISMTCMPLQTTPAVRIYFFVLSHSFSTVHNQPCLTVLYRESFFFLCNISSIGPVKQCWIILHSPRLLCPHTHIVNIVNACTSTTHAQTQTILSTATTHTVLCLPLSVDGFSHPTCIWEPTILSCRFLNVHRTVIS